MKLDIRKPWPCKRTNSVPKYPKIIKGQNSVTKFQQTMDFTPWMSGCTLQIMCYFLYFLYVGDISTLSLNPLYFNWCGNTVLTGGGCRVAAEYASWVYLFWHGSSLIYVTRYFCFVHRPEEVGQIFSMFVKDYEDVYRMMISSSVRTLAGTSLTVDNFRFNRTLVENRLHNRLRTKLGGMSSWYVALA